MQKDVNLRNSQGGFHVYCLPFHFVVPYETISRHGDLNPEFLRLPPSTASKTTQFDPRKTYPQIQYFIQVAHIRIDAAINPYYYRHNLRYVNIVPYSSEALSLWVADFPEEYKTCTTSVLNRHPWIHTLGHIQLWAAEPNPVNLLTLAAQASTVLSLKMRFTPCITFKKTSYLWNWACSVSYCIRSQTFSSTRKLDQIPTLSAIRTDPTLGMVEKKTKWKTWDFHSLSWTKEDHEVLEANDTRGKQDEAWIATLDIPVNISTSLSPTFLNVLSARRYAIILRFSLKNLHHGVLELKVPVQLIYSPSDAASQELGGSSQCIDYNAVLWLVLKNTIMNQEDS